MIVVRGWARVRPEGRDAAMLAISTVTASTAQDDGCLVYVFAADLGDADVIRNVEVWRDQAALDEHLTHEHTAEFLSSIGPWLDGEPTMEFVSA